MSAIGFLKERGIYPNFLEWQLRLERDPSSRDVHDDLWKLACYDAAKIDPDRKPELLAMSAAGGEASGLAAQKKKAALPHKVPAAPKTLKDAVKVASWITRAVLIGEIDVRVAEAATKAVRQFQLGLEKRELQVEVDRLQAALKAARK